MNPVAEQIALLHRMVPDARRVGLLYTGSEINSQIQARLAKEALEELGSAVVELTVTSSNEVQQTVVSLLDQVTSSMCPRTTSSPPPCFLVAQAALDKGVPVACGEEGQVHPAAPSPRHQLFPPGRADRPHGAKLLRGEAKVAAMPIQSQTEFEHLINKPTARPSALRFRGPAALRPVLLTHHPADHRSPRLGRGSKGRPWNMYC